jgi:Rrf2 family protein
LAVRALVVLGHSPGGLKGGELAAALETTPGFVPQVMGPLVRAGWVRSEPGPSGGYRPIVELGDLTVLEVIEVVDGPTDDGRCVVSNGACVSRQPCALHAAWARARRELMATLGAMPVTAAEAG